MIVIQFRQTVKEYAEAEICPGRTVPVPERCPRCQAEGELIRWGRYKRWVKTGEEKYDLQIQRVRCKACGGSQALLPDFLHPYRHYALKLLQRVHHLRQIVAWADALQAQLGPTKAADQPNWARFEAALATAHKLLADQDEPEGKDRLRSAVEPEARRGKHGAYYDGYLCDISQDPDSELLTALKVLPANGDEAADARPLLEAEQQAHGNRIEALSIDSVGFQGPLLRDLSDPTDMNLTVYVPPHSQGIQDTPYFKPADFQLSPDGQRLMCPNEVETDRRHRNNKATAWVFHFKRSRCAACPLLDHCLAKLPAKHRRSVSKNDYQAEYDAARQLAQTDAYAQVRKQHPKVERKLAEIVRYHGGRRARYRGLDRVNIQFLLTGIVVNIKRIIRLLGARATAALPQSA